MVPMPQRLCDLLPPPAGGEVGDGEGGGLPLEYVIDSRLDVVLPAESVTVMVMSFVPSASGIDAVQLLVPVAVPLCPVSAFDQLTCETPPASEAVPVTVRGVEEAGPEEGEPIVMVGGVVSAGPPVV